MPSRYSSRLIQRPSADSVGGSLVAWGPQHPLFSGAVRTALTLTAAPSTMRSNSGPSLPSPRSFATWLTNRSLSSATAAWTPLWPCSPSRMSAMTVCSAESWRAWTVSRSSNLLSALVAA